MVFVRVMGVVSFSVPEVVTTGGPRSNRRDVEESTVPCGDLKGESGRTGGPGGEPNGPGERAARAAEEGFDLQAPKCQTRELVETSRRGPFLQPQTVGSVRFQLGFRRRASCGTSEKKTSVPRRSGRRTLRPSGILVRHRASAGARGVPQGASGARADASSFGRPVRIRWRSRPARGAGRGDEPSHR